MGSFCGTSSGQSSGTQTVINTSQLPEHLQKASQENIARAKDIAARPYTAYNDERIAAFNNDQKAAMTAVRNNTGAWKPGVTEAETMTRGAAGPGITAPTGRAATIADYVNPYTELLLAPQLDAIFAAGSQAQSRLGRQAATRGSGQQDRLMVMRGDITKQVAKTAGDTVGQTYAQAWDKGATQFNTDKAREMAAAAQIGSLADQRQKQGLTDAQALSEIGAQEQGMDQAALDLKWSDFLRQQNYPIEMLNLMLGATSNTPSNTTNTSTGPAPYQPSTFGQTLGGVGAGAAGLAMLAKAFS